MNLPKYVTMTATEILLTVQKRQDNITILLDLLETRDFYSRLYSLQLMSHICNARPERTQECIFTAPLGISRLVNVLTDIREPVRNGMICCAMGFFPQMLQHRKRSTN